jgi:hypothetical protein
VPSETPVNALCSRQYNDNGKDFPERFGGNWMKINLKEERKRPANRALENQ